jgi:hypothetical protein
MNTETQKTIVQPVDFINQKMLALSWRQPFGTAMLYGKIETRTWVTSYKGWVLICTSKKGYDDATTAIICGAQNFTRLMDTLDMNDEAVDAGMPDTRNLHGYAIAIGKLVKCSPMAPEDEEETFVEYHPGLWCHVYEEVRPIKPFAWKGSRKWSTVTDEQKQLIELI